MSRGTLFEAGAGTTAAAMMSWILAMVHYPEELKKLQGEVDKVVGDDRLPEFDDVPQLPRVRAVAKEVSKSSIDVLQVLELTKCRLFGGDQLPQAASHTSQRKTTCTKGCTFPQARTSIRINGPSTAIHHCILILRLSSLIVGCRRNTQLSRSH